jgi:hypothetical protein
LIRLKEFLWEESAEENDFEVNSGIGRSFSSVSERTMLYILISLTVLLGQSTSVDPFEQGLKALRSEKVQEAAYYFKKAAVEDPKNAWQFCTRQKGIPKQL